MEGIFHHIPQYSTPFLPTHSDWLRLIASGGVAIGFSNSNKTLISGSNRFHHSIETVRIATVTSRMTQNLRKACNVGD